MEAVALETFLPFISAFGAFILAYSVMPAIIDVSHIKRLFDDPSNERKLHMTSIPNLGGVGIFASVVIIFSLSGYALQFWSPYLAAGLTMLFFSGVKDDILVISSFKKLSIQAGAIIALMFGGNLVITDLGGVFGFHTIPYLAGAALTFFTMVVVVNAYNLIDGIDGLAGGIGIIASLFFGWWFWQVGMLSHAILGFTLAGALLAFMKYNFEPASIFMGDTGSQVVGYLLAFLAVTFVKVGVVTADAVPFKNIVPVLILSVLIVPLYDTLRVFIVRTYRGQSPFKADRLHVHHQLIDMGFSHRACCYILYTFNLGIMGLTILLASFVTNINILLGVVLLTAMIVFPTVEVKRKILSSFGVKMPSRRKIQILELKYGMSPKTVGSNKNGNGHSVMEKSEQENEELEGLAV